MAGKVRHPIDVQKLEDYIRQHVPEIEVPLEVKQFGFGQSNPTYQLSTLATGTRYVLRKKPPGKLLSQAAHKVEREYRIIQALGPTDVPVPKTYCLCEDESVIGTPFYIMEFLDGRIFEDPAMLAPDISPEERTKLWEAATRTLAQLHRVDIDAAGLGTYGKRTGFYDRQLATWRQICSSQAQAKDADTGEPVGQMPHFEELVRFFSHERKPHDRATLVHGDYKIDNLVFHKSEPRVIGILDWEMSTVGHPLSDLANLLLPFYTTSIPTRYFRGSTFLSTPGLPKPETVLAWYRDVARWDPQPALNWAMAFSVFRSSAICQGIAARVATRQASSQEAKNYAEMVGPFAEYAWKLVEKEKASGEESTPAAKL